MLRLVRHQALLIFVAAIVFLSRLGSYGLFDKQESTISSCSAEMVRTGHWMVPTFNDHLNAENPILFYWSQAISFRLFGISEFSARLGSSILAIATVVLTYHLGRKLFSLEVGILAAIILCTCLVFSAFGRAATPDSMLVFLQTFAITWYVWIVARQRGGNFNGFGIAPSVAVETPPDPAITSPTASQTVPAETEPSTEQTTQEASEQPVRVIRPDLKLLVPGRWQLALPVYIAMGLAVLTTGLIGFVIPCTAIMLFLLVSLRYEDLRSSVLKDPEGPAWRRSLFAVLQTLRPRPLVEACLALNLPIGLAVVAIIAAPWYVAAGVVTDGIWLREFFFDRHVNRWIDLTSGSLWIFVKLIYDILVILILGMPWTVFLGMAVVQLRDRLDDEKSFWRASDRLLTCWITVWFLSLIVAGGILPNFVLPICPAVALILARFFLDWQHQEGDEGIYTFNLCCKALGAAGATMMLGFYIAAYLYFPSEEWLGLIGLVPLAGTFAAIKFLDKDQRPKVIQSLLVTAVLVSFLIVAIGPSRIAPYQEGPRFVTDAKRIAGTDSVEIGTYDYFEPSLVFYTGKSVPRLRTPREVADFVSGKSNAFVITRRTKENELRDELRGDVGEVARHRSFLGREDLILIGRK